MLTIGIIDDGVGIFPTWYKLRQVVSANFVGLLEQNIPLGKQPRGKLCALAKDYVDQLVNLGCDGIVISSIDLSVASFKQLSATVQTPLFGCEAPIMHASTYTISNVLVVGDVATTKNLKFPNVIPCPMTEFATLAQKGNQRDIVQYITQVTAPFDGNFDCIALAHSSMNGYKSCFSRVFPNVQIFDSLEGVARRVRKKFKKNNDRQEGTFTIINQNGEDVTANYEEFLQ